MIHAPKRGTTQKGGILYYTCKVGLGHLVNVVRPNDKGKWVACEDKLEVVGVVITHRKGCGLPEPLYTCADGETYSEDRVHRTLIDAKIAAYSLNNAPEPCGV